MTAAADLDLEAVARWLANNAPSLTAPISAQKIAGGQSNPTFLLATSTGRLVLRRKPPGELLKSAHAVDREYRVQRALASTNVPVPKMHAFCNDESVIGSMFYVMDHIDGRNFDDPRLPGVAHEERALILVEMARVLARIHAVDLKAAGLTDYGRPGN
ncbi:MAG: phosphotransferase, partial [Pseudomonadota bacterium]